MNEEKVEDEITFLSVEIPMTIESVTERFQKIYALIELTWFNGHENS